MADISNFPIIDGMISDAANGKGVVDCDRLDCCDPNFDTLAYLKTLIDALPIDRKSAARKEAQEFSTRFSSEKLLGRALSACQDFHPVPEGTMATEWFARFRSMLEEPYATGKHR